MEKWTDIASWPPLAAIAFGITFAVISFIARAGINAGKLSAPTNSPAAAQVATIIVDPTALNNATSAVKDLVQVIDKGHDKQEDHAHMLCRRMEALAGEVENLSRSMSALVLEMARKR